MAERQFGPYQLVRQIAVGGMAEIHLAKTRGIAGFEKYCALKMIHPNFAQDEQFIEMLIDEAKIAVQLQHVNVAQTFDLGRVGGSYYITMEFVDGADLYKILRRGSEQDLDMPLDVAAFVAKEMATGLDYAHRKKDGGGVTLGIVHRDISPQNVLVSNAGEVKLVDFGIAKATMKVRQTAVGVIKGKYYYMSPEQAWGERIDYRSDIFSAGIVLYEMLTGQMLYLEEDLHKLLDMVRRASIAPVRTLRRDVPPQLEHIVMHALAKKPEDRYQSAGDLASDLERFLHGYSPVFTASKLAGHIRRVLGEQAPPAAVPSSGPAPRDPNRSTKSIEPHTFATNRSDISDENSVIFRVNELGRPPPMPDGSTTPPPPPPIQRRSPTGQVPTVRTPTGQVPTVRTPTGQVPTVRTPTGQVPTLRPPVDQVRLRPPTSPIPSRPPTQPVRTRPPTEPTDPTLSARPRAPTAPLRPAIAPPRGPLPPLRSRPPTEQPPARGSLPPLRLPPDPMVARASPRMINAATMAGVEDEVEHTVVTGQPTMDAATGSDRPRGMRAASELQEELGDYEPTMIEASMGLRPSGQHEEDSPTLARGHGVPSVAPEDASTAPRRRPPGPQPAALSAHTPTPAVSELRRPRESRRTPAGGVPVAGSVLQALVGNASAPMPRPARGGGAPISDGVPATLRDPASTGAPTAPVRGRPPSRPPAVPPGRFDGLAAGPLDLGPDRDTATAIDTRAIPSSGVPHEVPASVPGAGLPAHLAPYALPQVAALVSPYPQPEAAPGGPGPYPFQPYGGQHPLSFSKQMQALTEIDELPAQYRLPPARSGFLRIALVVLLLSAVVIGTIAIIRGNEQIVAEASLLIESSPAGAVVTVDGQALSEPTPARFVTRPAARHELVVTLAGHQPHRDVVLVPDSGGQLKVFAFLPPMTVTLRVLTTPAGAEVYIGDQIKGRTPLELTGLSPEALRTIDVRHKDFLLETRTLDWTGKSEQTVEIKLRK